MLRMRFCILKDIIGVHMKGAGTADDPTVARGSIWIVEGFLAAYTACPMATGSITMVGLVSIMERWKGAGAEAALVLGLIPDLIRDLIPGLIRDLIPGLILSGPLILDTTDQGTHNPVSSGK
jgi:hypothetical protein